jgi:hypothetical protein
LSGSEPAERAPILRIAELRFAHWGVFAPAVVWALRRHGRRCRPSKEARASQVCRRGPSRGSLRWGSRPEPSG